MDETTYRHYSDRLSNQMSRIAEVGREIESAFGFIAAACPDANFINDAMMTFRTIGGRSGDAALEIYRDLDKDIRTAQRFLDKWKGHSGHGYDPILRQARDLYEELLHLREIVNEAGPEMMAEAKRRVRAQRSGCFVATSVYGNPAAPEVVVLRQIRDEVLLESGLGRMAVKAYYNGLGRVTARCLDTLLQPTKPVIRRMLDYVVQRYLTREQSGSSSR